MTGSQVMSSATLFFPPSYVEAPALSRARQEEHIPCHHGSPRLSELGSSSPGRQDRSVWSAEGIPRR